MGNGSDGSRDSQRDGMAALVPALSGIEGVSEQARKGRLELADRLTTLGTLATAIGHELNNPLTYVIGNLSYVLDGLTAPDSEIGRSDVIEALRDALGGAERIALIVKDMRSLGRQGEVKVEPVDLEGALELAIRQTSTHIRHRARLTRRFSQVPLVDADVPRICQVFVNLLLNAAQAIPQGEARRNEIAVELRADGDDAIVEITDTGAGIPPEVLAHVFEPFFTTKPVGEGTGLGLAISRSIVRSFDGELRITSTPRVGTTVQVRLPKSRQKEETAGDTQERAYSPVPVPVPVRARRPRILVIDDDVGVLGAAGRLLERHYDVETRTDGRSVLPYLAQGPRFDVILCDLMMPDMTGIELYHEISRRSAELAERIVFMTGGAFTPDAEAFLESRNRMHVSKPFDAPELLAAVEAVISCMPERPASLAPETIGSHGDKGTELLLRFPKEWHHIDVVRESCGFFARAAYRDVLVGQRIEIVVHELVENAIRYATAEENHVEVDLHGGAREFEVAVSSRSSREHVGTLMGVLAELDKGDPAEAYLSAMRRCSSSSDDAGGLGLARVAHEAKVRLSADFTSGSMRLVARGVP